MAKKTETVQSLRSESKVESPIATGAIPGPRDKPMLGKAGAWRKQGLEESRGLEKKSPEKKMADRALRIARSAKRVTPTCLEWC
jgi:hypothetical protein